ISVHTAAVMSLATLTEGYDTNCITVTRRVLDPWTIRVGRVLMSDTVLVTGANSGIGLAAVQELARRGFHAVGSVRSEEKARHVRAEAEKAGVTVDTVLLDVTDAVAR